MSDDTPTADEVRAGYVRGRINPLMQDETKAASEFNRWLAARDREVAARTLREAADDAKYRPGWAWQEPPRWLHDVLLADPTDTEVTSVAEALVAERYRMHGVDLEKAKSSVAMWQLDIEFLRPQARAAIAAFLTERRGSE